MPSAEKLNAKLGEVLTAREVFVLRPLAPGGRYFVLNEKINIVIAEGWHICHDYVKVVRMDDAGCAVGESILVDRKANTWRKRKIFN